MNKLCDSGIYEKLARDSGSRPPPPPPPPTFQTLIQLPDAHILQIKLVGIIVKKKVPVSFLSDVFVGIAVVLALKAPYSHVVRSIFTGTVHGCALSIFIHNQCANYRNGRLLSRSEYDFIT